MSKVILCNPLNIDYRYQFNVDPRMGGKVQINREAADPSMICFKGRYYIFASMQLSVWVSDDLAHWTSIPLPEELPLYDYAPDVRVLGEYVYFSASKRGEICDFFRTKDIENGPYERIPGTFTFWDPNLFADDDGRVYFYWGCTNSDPIWGVELDPATMAPLTEPKGLIKGDPFTRGYERVGEDHCKEPASAEEIEASFAGFLKAQGISEGELPPGTAGFVRGMFSNMPYIEGAWMTKHGGKYYLQYACTGTEYNVYGDGVYVGDSPLGEFVPARNNPFSYKPGGFLPGAGHGSTMEDAGGNWWHTATMRISINHSFERRVGIWPAGFDADGELFCNQRYGDWPIAVDTNEAMDPWRGPEWMLLSFGKKAAASSETEGKPAGHIADENVQTLWRPLTKDPGEWVMLDLGKTYDVRAIQVNFGDADIDIPIPGKVVGSTQARYIDVKQYPTRWKLLGRAEGDPAEEDGWFVVEDRTQAATDLSHDFLVREEGIAVRYLKLTEMSVPYDQIPAVSGLRVFGLPAAGDEGKKPDVPGFKAVRTGSRDMEVTIAAGEGTQALGYNILFGHAPDKLYHSYMVFGRLSQHIGALVEGQECYVRVDAFNEYGITEGITAKAE
ncbi:MAG: family 43 glycosylhydrolase [Lachnospiraceae bacterium]|nr:family 43 glycosylhydrolase [Lachnospiraceae bacterium]